MPKLRKNEANWIESRQRWQINVQKDGERKTFTCSTPGTKGKIEAESRADKWLKDGQTDNIRFNKLWELFIEDTKARTSTANYKKHLQIGTAWILPIVAYKKTQTITIQDWQNCINNAYKKKHLAKKTLENIRGTITAVYRFAYKNRIELAKPEYLTIPKGAPVGERKILQPDDINILMSKDTVVKYKKEKFDYFIYAYRFILLTGIRRGELCGIKKSDVEDSILNIKRSINSELEITTGKTNNARRYVVLSKYALEVLEQQKAMLKQAGIISPWLFPDEYGNMLNPKHLNKKWMTYRKQHGITTSLHEMRHTFISVAKADVPEQLLKQVVGHSVKMDTFGIYGHKVDGEMERVADTLDSIFSKIIK